jgi:hypothetical protein
MALPTYWDEILGEIALRVCNLCRILHSAYSAWIQTCCLSKKNSQHTFEIKRDRTCGFPQGMFILYLPDRCDTRHYPMTMSAIGTATRMLVSERVDIV